MKFQILPGRVIIQNTTVSIGLVVIILAWVHLLIRLMDSPGNGMLKI